MDDGATSPLDRLLLGLLFFGAFLGAYLAVPTNPIVPGTNLQVRPEPLVLIVALPFGRTAVLGATGGVFVHNLAFRLGPEVTLFFAAAQTVAVLIAGLVGLLAWTTVAAPARDAAAPAAFVLVFVPTMGFLSAAELGASAVNEMIHVFEELLIPQLLLGPLALATWERRGPVAERIRSVRTTRSRRRRP